MRDGSGLLISVLRDPSQMASLSTANWDLLLRTARKQALAARLACELRRLGAFDQVPPKARRQLQAASIACESSQVAVRFEIDRAARAIEAAGFGRPLIALKGAAYLVAALSVAEGRFIGDLDLMVSPDRLDAIERLLVSAGWVAAQVDDYDQHYYREWMHEIPPLQFPGRQTPVDLHHTILPRTARQRPDTAALHAAVVATADPRIRVPCPADMVLHGAVHLFNGESSKPLRDLVDQRDLMLQFDAEPGFWTELTKRARQHRLERPLYYSIRYCRDLLGLRVPDVVLSVVDAWGPPAPIRELMDALLLTHLRLGAGGNVGWRGSLANNLLLIRTHWLKMPMPMLIRHLAVKSAKRWRNRRSRRRRDDRANED
ncbi:MAG: nucleotidyltransferase family protein [Burkholderiaceae bacterium]|nr:nucleotidyltransferase family protein [Burkholderiaceae bacterium]